MKVKQRTHKGAAKRFRITKNGKVLHRGQGIRHLRTGKGKSTLRRKKGMHETTGVFAKKVKKLLGVK